MSRLVRVLSFSSVLLVGLVVPAAAQQVPSQSPAPVAGTASAPQPASTTPVRADSSGAGDPRVDLTLLGTPLLFFRQQLQKPAPALFVPRQDSVATYRVSVTADYAAEFVSHFGPIWALSPDEKRLMRMNAKGGGLDPMAAVRAYRHVAKSLEARRARKEVRLVMEELRRRAEAERLDAAAAEEVSRRGETPKKEDAPKKDAAPKKKDVPQNERPEKD